MNPSNILNIETLDEEWRDKDSVMLHACFQILKDFVEKELAETDWVDWEQDEKHKLAKQEIDCLYDWWLSYSKLDLSLWGDKYDYDFENQMLKRLIDVRWVMWT